MKAKGWWVRLSLLLLLSLAALELSLLLRLALMAWVDPLSTTFQRSEAWRLLAAADTKASPKPAWAQSWVPLSAISPNLVRAVVASEDAGFFEHAGFDWDALQKAAKRNHRLPSTAATPAKPQAHGQEARSKGPQDSRASKAKASANPKPSKLVGGSTISQQLAKNLLLSGERTWLRKAQEFVLTAFLELLLTKERILEIYLNSVEWGSGLFGAQAAAAHYFRVDAGKLSQAQAAKLAVMLPAPKRFEMNPSSPYLQQRAATIQLRMLDVDWPAAP